MAFGAINQTCHTIKMTFQFVWQRLQLTVTTKVAWREAGHLELLRNHTCEEEGNSCRPFWLSCLSQQLFKTSNQHQKVSILNGWKNHTNLHTKLTMGLRVYLVTPENHQVKYFSSPSQAPGSWGSVGILISLGQCSNKKLRSVFGKTNSSYLGLFSVVETFWMNLISKLRDRT